MYMYKKGMMDENNVLAMGSLNALLSAITYSCKTNKGYCSRVLGLVMMDIL